LSLYVCLSLLDLVLTGIVLRYSDGKIYESNPIAGEWLTQYGWKGLVIFKIVGLLLVSWVSIFVSTRSPKTGRRLLTFACIAVGLVVVYSWYLLMKVLPT
jgi:tryptophan-rich sensory protein